MNFETIVLCSVGALSVIATFVLHTKYNQSAVRASSLIGLSSGITVLLFQSFFSEYLFEHIPLVAFGASFIGMVSSSVISNYVLLGASGGLFAVLFLLSNSVFKGFGGGLGVAACISLLVALALSLILRKKRVQGVLVRIKSRGSKTEN